MCEEYYRTRAPPMVRTILRRPISRNMQAFCESMQAFCKSMQAFSFCSVPNWRSSAIVGSLLEMNRICLVAAVVFVMNRPRCRRRRLCPRHCYPFRRWFINKRMLLSSVGAGTSSGLVVGLVNTELFRSLFVPGEIVASC